MKGQAMTFSTAQHEHRMPGVTVRDASPAEFLHATLGQARLDVPSIRDIHKVPLRGPALELELVPMEKPR